MRNRAGPSRRWYPRLHRWLGISALPFVLLLSVTGIFLNHSSALSLDARHVRAQWLLRWYGVVAPPPTAAFDVDGHSVVLIGTRLYFDEQELAESIESLVGAVATPSHVVVATSSGVLLVSLDGRLVERVDSVGGLSIPIQALGTAGHWLAFETAAGSFRSDYDLLSFEPWPDAKRASVDWAVSQGVEPARLEALANLYRGRGLSVERLLLDLHSGRLLARFGPWLMDVVGVSFIALSLLGLGLWIQRWRTHQRRR